MSHLFLRLMRVQIALKFLRCRSENCIAEAVETDDGSARDGLVISLHLADHLIVIAETVHVEFVLRKVSSRTDYE